MRPRQMQRRRRLEQQRQARRRRPDWGIIAVFDPDGLGGDFAYTVGLHGKGLPELHMWARPTDGSDPGFDYKLSPKDLGVLINGSAERLIAGELGVGSAFSVPFDGGASQGHIVLGDPVDPVEVEALMVNEGALVIPMYWELDR